MQVSLSARRAWIENSTYVIRLPRCQVALRKESVDRKSYLPIELSHERGSLSARRAWIENCPTCQWRRSVKVALRKESVDRKFWLCGLLSMRTSVALRKESVDRKAIRWNTCDVPTSRSPQGERG